MEQIQRFPYTVSIGISVDAPPRCCVHIESTTEVRLTFDTLAGGLYNTYAYFQYNAAKKASWSTILPNLCTMNIFPDPSQVQCANPDGKSYCNLKYRDLDKIITAVEKTLMYIDLDRETVRQFVTDEMRSQLETIPVYKTDPVAENREFNLLGPAVDPEFESPTRVRLPAKREGSDAWIPRVSAHPASRLPSYLKGDARNPRATLQTAPQPSCLKGDASARSSDDHEQNGNNRSQKSDNNQNRRKQKGQKNKSSARTTRGWSEHPAPPV